MTAHLRGAILMSLAVLLPAIGDAQARRVQLVQEVMETELVYPQERGELQFTTGFRSQWNRGERLFAWPVTFEYGLTDHCQVQMEWGGATLSRIPNQGMVRGAADLNLGAKYSFMQVAGSPFHLALQMEVGLPTGTLKNEIGEGLVEMEPSIMIARDFPKLRYAQAFAQAGLGLVHRVRRAFPDLHGDDDEVDAHKVRFSGGIMAPIRSIVVTSEVAWESNRWSGGKENQVYFTPGAVFRLPAGWEAGVGVAVGVTPATPRVGLRIQLTREFSRRGETD